MSKFGFVYIMTNKNKTTLYIGVTNDLCRRIYEHKNHLIKNTFTERYNLEYCIYYEEFTYMDLAIRREKELKKWNRRKKEALIYKKNPEWKVLVTENGFIRETIPFSQQVTDLIAEMQKNNEIPPFGRNDDTHDVEGQRIPPFGRNDSSLDSEGNEIPPFGRNDSSPFVEEDGAGGGFAASCSAPFSAQQHVIPNGAKRSEESHSMEQQHVIPNGAKRSEESHCMTQQHVIPNGAKRSEESHSLKGGQS